MRSSIFLYIITSAVSSALPGEPQSETPVETLAVQQLPTVSRSGQEVKAVVDSVTGVVSIAVPLQQVERAITGAESLEIQIIRTKRYWLFSRSTTERHSLNLGPGPLAGDLAFDEDYVLGQSKGAQISNEPGVPSSYWHDIKVMRTGGRLFVSRQEGLLSFSLFYRRVVGVSKRESDIGHHYDEITITGVVPADPLQPTVLKNVTPTISKIVITRTN